MSIKINMTSAGQIQNIGFSQKEDTYQQDLSFIFETLLENHPGIFNPQDPDFYSRMLKNFELAKRNIVNTNVDAEKEKNIEDFISTFNDAHLRIGFYGKAQVQVLDAVSNKYEYSIEEIKNSIFWVNIPSFKPSENDGVTLKNMIHSIENYREKTLVFDLRGNGGGSTFYGENLLKSLYGEEFASKCLAMFHQNFYQDWRASKGNLEHVNQLVLDMIEEYGEYYSAIEWIKKVQRGMEEALSRNEVYFSDPLIDSFEYNFSAKPVSKHNKKIYAIIDKNCGSATLCFLDWLKFMGTDVSLIGEPTKADTSYSEFRSVSLPSGKGVVGFPIKINRGHPNRESDSPHSPDISFKDLENTQELHKFVLSLIRET